MKYPKKSSYPDSIRVRRKDYSLEFVPVLDALGQCDDEAKTIEIRSDLSERETFKTIIHELLHAIDCEFGLKLTHKQVYGLERGIHNVLCVNRLGFLKTGK